MPSSSTKKPAYNKKEDASENLVFAERHA